MPRRSCADCARCGPVFHAPPRRFAAFQLAAQVLDSRGFGDGAALAEQEGVVALGLILSLAIGVSLGLLGGGGSILTVPVLHYAFGMEAHAAITTSLLVVGATSAVTMLRFARIGRVRWRIGLAFGSASMFAAFAGGRIGAQLPGTALIIGFAALMLVAGGAMIRRARSPLAEIEGVEMSLPRVMAIGVGVGLLTGILGAGGGFVIVPALTLLGGLAIVDAIGTSLLVIAMNSFAGLLGNITHAHVDMRLALIVTGIAIGGSFLGTLIASRMHPRHLGHAFGIFVVAVGAAILARELLF
jgi:uncharacterized membrane protein YfcA